MTCLIDTSDRHNPFMLQDPSTGAVRPGVELTPEEEETDELPDLQEEAASAEVAEAFRQ